MYLRRAEAGRVRGTLRRVVFDSEDPVHSEVCEAVSTLKRTQNKGEKTYMNKERYEQGEEGELHRLAGAEVVTGLGSMIDVGNVGLERLK